MFNSLLAVSLSVGFNDFNHDKSTDNAPAVPVGVETSFVVMMAPLLLTTIIGPELLLGMAALEGLGKILLGCICCVMIFTPTHIWSEQEMQLMDHMRENYSNVQKPTPPISFLYKDRHGTPNPLGKNIIIFKYWHSPGKTILMMHTNISFEHPYLFLTHITQVTEPYLIDHMDSFWKVQVLLSQS